MEREQVIERLRRYVDMPSGSYDEQGLNAFVDTVGGDMRALGFTVERRGKTLVCTLGSGRHSLLLLGHMDTVFPREYSKPLSVDGEMAYGSGVMDMKGGLLIMQEAVRRLGGSLPEDTRITAVLNGDEEIGSEESHELIEQAAKEAFACLVFEPMRESGAIVGQRKGVISFDVCCTGIPGHSGAAYLKSASAIQQLSRVIDALYTIRDDVRQISINVGTICGGTAENVVAAEAKLTAEVRYFDPAYSEELMGRIRAICSEKGIAGTTTTLTIHASHPPFKANEKCMKLQKMALAIAAEMGMHMEAESTGGAGDVAFAAKAGIAALDGLGLLGFCSHTANEHGEIASFERNVQLSEQLMRRLLNAPEAVM